MISSRLILMLEERKEYVRQGGLSDDFNETRGCRIDKSIKDEDGDAVEYRRRRKGRREGGSRVASRRAPGLLSSFACSRDAFLPISTPSPYLSTQIFSPFNLSVILIILLPSLLFLSRQSRPSSLPPRFLFLPQPQ